MSISLPAYGPVSTGAGLVWLGADGQTAVRSTANVIPQRPRSTMSMSAVREAGVHLTPRERERLEVAAGADLARRRIARGAQLGAAEAIALVCDEVQEMAWDDVPLAEILLRAPAIAPRDRLLPDVPALVPVIEIEALFPHGTVLVHVMAPFGPPSPDSAGSIRPAAEQIDLAPGRRRAVATLRNTGRLPIWVSSHVPLDSLNPALEVSVTEPGRYRLDQPAGSSVKVDPGQQRQVSAVQIVADRS